MVAANLALALAPSLVLLWWAVRRDSVRKESPRLIVLTFVSGLLAVVPALAIGLVIDPFGGFVRGVGRTLIQAFIGAALVEEGVKYALLAGLVRRQRQFAQAEDGVVYGMAASLGFAFLENVIYVTGPPAVLLLRGVTAVPLHAGCGALVGYTVGRAHFDDRRRPALGLLAAVGVHGTYDALVFADGWVSYLSLAVVALLVGLVPHLFRLAIADDVASGRTRQKPSSGP